LYDLHIKTVLVITKCAKQAIINEAKISSQVEHEKLKSCEKPEMVLKDKLADIFPTKAQHDKQRSTAFCCRILFV